MIDISESMFSLSLSLLSLFSLSLSLALLPLFPLSLPSPSLFLFSSAARSLVNSCRFVQSRDQHEISTRLSRFSQVKLEVGEVRNQADLRTYLSHVARRHVTLELATEDFETQLEREFGLAPFTLRGELQGLDTLLRRAKDAHAVVISKVESLGDFRDLCNIADITIAPSSCVPLLAASQETRKQQQQQQYVRQCSNDLDVLYADAEQAHTKLRSLFARKWRVCKEVARVDGGGSKTVLSVPVQGETEEWVDKVVDPGPPSVRLLKMPSTKHMHLHIHALVSYMHVCKIQNSCGIKCVDVKRTEEQSLCHAEDYY